MPIDTSLKGLLRNLMGPNGVPGFRGNAATNDPVSLSHTLMTARGEASGVAIADRVLTLIEALNEDGIATYFAALRDEFEVDLDAVLSAAERAREDGAALKALQLAAEPPRQELFRRLNAAPRGTARLVKMRTRLLNALRSDKTLAPIDSDLRHLLRSWFNRGFLLPARIDWQSPADLLEKIIAYEAVHAIDTWDALRERLVPTDRRCFAFFHPAMPNEPLIFVEVALTKGLAGSIQDVLASPREVLAAEDTDSAIFYSISNCQAGLAGISFGAFLIKQVASDLQAELPTLRTFSTLSPIPGFAAWAAENDASPQAAAVYLAEAKDAHGKPLDPVAKFHLGNGAELHRINENADLSPKGITQSHGMMVNYLYELDQVEARHEAFAATGEVAISRAVRQALGRPRPWAQTDRTAKQADEGQVDDDQPTL